MEIILLWVITSICYLGFGSLILLSENFRKENDFNDTPKGVKIIVGLIWPLYMLIHLIQKKD